MAILSPGKRLRSVLVISSPDQGASRRHITLVGTWTCLCGGRPAHKQAGVRAAAALSQECFSHRFKDSSRIALPQWADLLTQPTATLLPPELCLAVRTISFLLAPLDLHGPEARVTCTCTYVMLCYVMLCAGVVILDLSSQRRPAGPPDPRPTYSASASHLPRPSEHPTDTHVSLPVPPVCSLIPQHGCARVHEADWREAVAL